MVTVSVISVIPVRRGRTAHFRLSGIAYMAGLAAASTRSRMTHPGYRPTDCNPTALARSRCVATWMVDIGQFPTAVAQLPVPNSTLRQTPGRG
jgi:hypothetical protein